MDLAELIVTGGGAALIALTLWFFFGKRPEAPRAPGGGAVYACPMHPWITSADPTASCSVCGMKLVREEGGL